MDSGGFMEPEGIVMLAIMVLVPLFAVLIIASLWKIFSKAGQPGWAAIIPIYNLYVFTRVIRRPGWWLLLYIGVYVIYYSGMGMALSGNSSGGILSILGSLAILVILVMDYHRLSTSFGQGVGFTIGLLLLGIIFFPLLAFGSYSYEGRGSQPGGPLDHNL